MKHITPLDELSVLEIQGLAEEKRRALGFVGSPIAANILAVLEKLNITLLQLPVEPGDESPAFSGALLYSKVDGEDLAFVGVNTADYFDKQIFAIAHELYHFFTKTGSHLSRVDEDRTLTEALANRFAAEFLLPETELRKTIINEFKTPSLRTIPHKKLLRFIARLQCIWWLPYRAIVKRFEEIDAIRDGQVQELYRVDERDPLGEYARMGMAIDDVTFTMLNKVTRATGTSQSSIELIIRNYEDNLIDEDKFADILGLFGKSPGDFGYDFGVDREDIEELSALFSGEAGNEDQPDCE